MLYPASDIDQKDLMNVQLENIITAQKLVLVDKNSYHKR